MILGFTGTREGLTPFQRAALVTFLVSTRLTEIHHGDCRGADAELHEMARTLLVRTVIHPPSDPVLRAFCTGTEVLPARPYLVRDRDIAEACEELAACPDGPERAKSGTWYTIRQAWRLGKTVTIFYPDGQVQVDEKGVPPIA
jgi:hypothetical protein